MHITDILKTLAKARKFSNIAAEAKLELMQAKADDGKIDLEELLGVVSGVLDEILTGGLLTHTPDPVVPVKESDIPASDAPA